VAPLPFGLTYVHVDSGSNMHSIAQRSDGSFVGWGWNYHREAEIPPPPPGTRFVQVSAGALSTIARYEFVCAQQAYCTAGTSTNGCTATLQSAGTPSASAAAGFTLSASNVDGQKSGLQRQRRRERQEACSLPSPGIAVNIVACARTPLPAAAWSGYSHPIARDHCTRAGP